MHPPRQLRHASPRFPPAGDRMGVVADGSRNRLSTRSMWPATGADSRVGATHPSNVREMGLSASYDSYSHRAYYGQSVRLLLRACGSLEHLITCFDIYIIIFVALAIVMFLKLRSVLGQRT